ncbi:MAG: VOC family protein [Chthoniobacterales bacterium]|nr:VOC family protein [Chthoniobacterales bacterium]
MHESLPRTIDYIEMPSRDLDATTRFFAGLFGWSFENYGPAYVAFDDGRTAGGFFSAPEAWTNAASCPLVVFYMPELEQALADVRRLGGRMTKDMFDFPGGRRFHFEAPGSGEFAIWSDR